MSVLDSAHNRKFIISGFSKLENDSNFKITSDNNVNYNCIAWAGDTDDEWWWPIPNPPKIRFDGAKVNWPFDLPPDESLDTFKKLFENMRYVECDSHVFEDSYKKIAIYVKPGTNTCTHASRQLRNGLWTSKMGKYFDIQHSDPYSIEGSVYGKVACIMKQFFY